MIRPQPGWLVAACAAGLSVSCWLPWLVTGADGGGHGNAIGGTVGALHLPPGFGTGQLIVLGASVLLVAAAMTARGLLVPYSAIAGLVLGLGLAGLIVWFYRQYVVAPVHLGYGFYLGAGFTVAAVALAIWSIVDALAARRGPAPPLPPPPAGPTTRLPRY
ncbi:hypothetical protein MINS_40450 [Mycolicibacterium insubricum]|uniref:Uncharacterized protein n=1 Tax=Mycolicibacterium insubricum TaxID=444597 RepID=A0A1X0DCA1_9MYCO|nr:hypothetical protein [Mycolicibacterium insubricum]MCB9442448.1 hypothetical protein [Mycolicibacterium sp.]ORA70034.1 hypothetical protein BST26_12160 [Mycolicibacterium insubricum]BBZ68616.1 hypothetical protein MINS_40450 [Mycolicibacterium insubricum]